MDIFNLKKAIDRALEQMALHGVGSKTIKNYRTTGFGSIIRYFEKKEIYDVNLNMLDAYLQDMYFAHSAERFSDCKWRLLRRGCELLKYFVTEGTIEMKALRPWDYSMGKPKQSVTLDAPTKEQFSNPDNLFLLIWKVRQALIAFGFTKRSIRHYTSEGLTIILHGHYEAGTEIYTKEIVDSLVLLKTCK